MLSHFTVSSPPANAKVRNAAEPLASAELWELRKSTVPPLFAPFSVMRYIRVNRRLGAMVRKGTQSVLAAPALTCTR